MSSADKWHCLLIFDVDQVLSSDAEIRRGNFWMQVRMLKYFFQNLCICVRLYANYTHPLCSLDEISYPVSQFAKHSYF